MSPHSTSELDRRHHGRIAPKGSVTIHALGHAHRGRLVNIGASGMYATTAITLADRLLGRVVELELRFDGALAAWQRLTGRIHRIDSGGVAIGFDAPTAPALVQMIDELATTSHASARVISVVLIDADGSRRSAIAAGFRAAGCEVTEAATPLEAIVRLGESHFEPDVIAVADSQPGTAADEMRAFIERDHARSLLLAIGPELFAPAAPANRLSSATGPADLLARIRELLLASITKSRDGG